VNIFEITVAHSIAGSNVGDRNCWTFTQANGVDGSLPGGVSISIVDWTAGAAVDWDQASPLNFTGGTLRVCATANQPGEFMGLFSLSSGSLAAWASGSDGYVWTLDAALQSVSVSTDTIVPYGQAQQLLVTLGDAVEKGLTLTPRSDVGVTFTPASVTLQPGEYAASFAMSYQPTASPVETVYVYFDLSGNDEYYYETPSPAAWSVRQPEVTVHYNARGGNQFAYSSESVLIQLEVPAVQGLTVEVYSTCFATGSATATFAAGESAQQLTFTGDNDFDVYNTQRCGISYELSGPDQWLFAPPGDSTYSVGGNTEQRFWIGTTEWRFLGSLASSSGSLF
jgi:hypothetical protein